MDGRVQRFFEELRQNPEVLALILFGSYARGDSRPDSDIDLLVIIPEGETARRIETRSGMTYEMIWVTESGALEYWHSDRDGCFGLWRDAQVIFDKNGATVRLRAGAKRIIAQGKRRLSESELAHRRFDAEDQLRAIKGLAEDDITAANHALHDLISRLVESFFDIERIWTPPPKRALQTLRKTNPRLATLLDAFYTPALDFERSTTLADEIIREILGQ